MKCPYCQEEMLSGRIIGNRYHLKWLPDEEKLFLGFLAVDSMRLGESGFFGRPKLRSHICGRCKKLIADIE
jgi:hypothetical protein